MLKKLTLLCSLTLAFSLTACFGSHKPKAHAAAKPSYTKVDPKTITNASLMRAVFGKNYRPKEEDAFGTFLDDKAVEQAEKYLFTAYDHTVLPTGEVLLVVDAEVADEDGKSMSAHGSEGILNIYVLRHQKKGWVVVNHHENVDQMGSHGALGVVKWVNLGAGKTGLAIESGGTWQGYSISGLSLYDVSHGDVIPLNKESIDLHSDNRGACEDESKCWDVTAEYHFVPSQPKAKYDDLLLTFEGDPPANDEDEASEAQASKPTQPGANTNKKLARYHFNGKTYTLIEGENIVPGV